MPDTTNADRQTMTVQPREIREMAFRALFSAGADPAEALHGAEAVLHMEAETGKGIALLPALTQGDWHAMPARAAADPIPGHDAVLLAHRGYGQAALRTMIQLVDLVVEHADDAGTVIAYTSEANLGVGLWDALAARVRILTRRATAVAVVDHPDHGPGAVTFSQVHGGPTEPGQSAAAEAAATLAAGRTAGGTALILLPQKRESAEAVPAVPPRPIIVDAEQWETAYGLAGAYLVSDR